MITKNWYKMVSACVFTTPFSNATVLNASLIDYKGVNRSAKHHDTNLVNTAINIGNIIKTKTNATYENSYGVCFGDGDTPATSDDYNMAGNIIKTLSCTGTPTVTADATKATLSCTYTLTNTGSTEVTIREVGTFGYMYYGSSYSLFLLDRTVLDTPVIIPAGGIGQVTYTIRMNYPTA